MTNKQILFANLTLVLVLLFTIFMVNIWSYSPIGMMCVIVMLVVAYWRFKIFPYTGFLLIKRLVIGAAVYALLGTVLGISIALICDIVFHLQMQHGLGMSLIGGGIIVGFMSGCVSGYLKYKKTI